MNVADALVYVVRGVYLTSLASRAQDVALLAWPVWHMSRRDARGPTNKQTKARRSAVPPSAGRGGRESRPLRNLLLIGLLPVTVACSEQTRMGAATRDLSDAVLFASIERGDASNAIASYEAAANVFLREGDRVSAAFALTRGMSVALRTGDYQKVTSLGQQGLEILRTAKPDPVRLLILHLLGSASWSIGELEEASRLWEQGFALLDSHTDSRSRPLHAGMLLRDLGRIALHKGDRARALEHFYASILALESYRECWASPGELCVVARREIAYSLLQLAPLEGPSAGERSLKQALSLSRQNRGRDTELVALVALGDLAISRSEPRQAETRFREALQTLPKESHLAHVIRIRAGLGRALLLQGLFGKALEELRASAEALESVRGHLETASLRGSFLGTKQFVYQDAVDAAFRAGQPLLAFEVAERSRARAFLDSLGTRTLVSNIRDAEVLAGVPPGVDALVEESLRVGHATPVDENEPGMLGATRTVRATTVASYQTLLDRVRRENPKQSSLLTVDTITADIFQSLLPNDSTAIVYFVAPKETFAWILEQGRIETVRLPLARTRLVSLVEEYRRSITDRAPIETVESKGLALYGEILEPIWPLIRGRQLVIVPHDVLHYVPFSAVPTSVGRRVLDDYVVSTLPSASVLKYLDSKGQGLLSRPVAIGNPAVPGVASLPFAEREARMVGGHFSNATILIGEKATEAAVKKLAKEASLVHFASHADLREDDPSLSAIMLAPSSTDDGRLDVQEILQMRINARLVVLSACETALGRLTGGDELVSLQRAFLHSGAGAVLTTLWKVDDKATYDLMRVFYEQLQTRTPADALREAQRTSLRQDMHPFAWGAFVLTGLPQ